MLEIPKRKTFLKNPKAGGIMATVTNKNYTLKCFMSSNNLKRLLYRRADILNMYNYTKVDVYVN